MNLKDFRDYKYSTSLDYASAKADGIEVDKYIMGEEHECKSSNLKALYFNFVRFALKRKNLNCEEFVESWLKDVNIEFCEFSYLHNMKKLPEALAKQPLKYLKLYTVLIEDMSNVLPSLTDLRQLEISTQEKELKWGNLQELKKLNKLKIKSYETLDLSEIWKLTNLEYLEIETPNIREIPKEINQLKRLKFLYIKTNKVNKIDEEVHLPNLEHLEIEAKKGFINLPQSLFSDKLINLLIKVDYVKDIVKLPKKIKLNSAEKIVFRGFTCDEFPEMIVPNVLDLELNIRAKDFLKNIKQADNLRNLEINIDIDDDITNLQANKIEIFNGVAFHSKECMDFSIWPNLKKISLGGRENKKINIADNMQLESLWLYKADCFKELNNFPKSIQKIELIECNKLKSIQLVEGLCNLKSVRVSKCKSLEFFKMPSNNFNELTSLNILDCPNFKSISSTIFLAKKLKYISVYGSSKELMDDKLDMSLYDLIDYMDKQEFSDAERAAMGYWLFRMYRFFEPENELITGSYQLLRHSNNDIFMLISKHFDTLQAKHKRFEDYNLEELKGKIIAILGKTSGTKTSLKAMAKELDMKPTTKPELADFLIVAKKTELAEIPHATILLEGDLNRAHEKLFQKPLKSESVPKQIKENLRLMLWSTDPATELTALEIMKQKGMPANVTAECIVIAKTSIDAKVKTKYKRFIKPYLNEDEQILLEKKIRLRKIRTNPFFQLENLSNDLLGKVATALYKRIGEFWQEVLDYNHEEKELRMEIINEYVIPEFAKRPIALVCDFYLHNSEIDYIIKSHNPTQKLEYLRLTIKNKELPNSVTKHTDIFDIELKGDILSKTLPSQLFEFKKLKKLKFRSTAIEEVDERVLEFKNLDCLIINTENPIKVANQVKENKQFYKRLHLWGGEK
ncbi:MAG: hypothetical protein N4A49_11575 [Marinifilaceae bacterium]|jgi:Leucine-rich repeat (LRR) protein|nr:hypothetical protein [Marinifilaceae bacterium]